MTGDLQVYMARAQGPRLKACENLDREADDEEDR